MSLTHDDVAKIRSIIREEVRPIVREEVRLAVREDVSSMLDTRLAPLEGMLEALENDVKEIYTMLAKAQRASGLGHSFQRLSLEHKLLRLNTELLAAARQAGISLPRS